MATTLEEAFRQALKGLREERPSGQAEILSLTLHKLRVTGFFMLALRPVFVVGLRAVP